MCGISKHTSSAALLESSGGVAQRAGRIDDVVGDDAGAPLDFTDDVHDFGNVGARTTLVDDGEVNAEFLGHSTGTNHTAHVGRDDHQVRVLVRDQIVQKNGCRVNVVDRDVEEALNLVGVQVHREHTVDAYALEHVGDNLGGDGHAGRTGTTVLTSVPVVGHHGGDTAARSAAQRIDHDHQFHQIVIGRRTGALKHESVTAADVLVDFNHNFAVGEAVDGCPSKRDVQVLSHCMSKLGIGIPREDLQAVRNHFYPLKSGCVHE